METKTQEQILLTFVQGEDGELWAAERDGWDRNDTSVALCRWSGISCENGDVTGIYLEGSSLIATLPAELGHLTTLRYLHLKENIIYGPIPDEVASLPYVEAIDLSHNRIQGQLPIFKSSALTSLNLADNALSGKISPEFGSSHPLLEVLDVSLNAMTGTIPESMGDMASVNELYLSENQFHGEIPGTLGKMTVLQVLHLDMNNFVGQIPRALILPGSLLYDFWLQGNQLSGTVPEALADLQDLMKLFIDGNKFTGTIPKDLCRPQLNEDFYGGAANTSTASDIDLCARIACPVETVSNEGVWPCEACDSGFHNPYLGRSGKCIDLDEREILHNFWRATNGHAWTEGTNWYHDGVDMCDFTGVTCNRDGRVVGIELPKYNLHGTIPEELGFLRHLEKLDLSDNWLSGYLPSDFRFASLTSFDLTGNALVGAIPPKLCFVEGLNGLGSNGDYNCDNILCPVGKYSRSGRAGNGDLCLPCYDDVPYMGRKICSQKRRPVATSSHGSLGGVDSNNSVFAGIGAVLLFLSLSGFLIYSYDNYARKRSSDGDLCMELPPLGDADNADYHDVSQQEPGGEAPYTEPYPSPPSEEAPNEKDTGRSAATSSTVSSAASMASSSKKSKRKKKRKTRTRSVVNGEESVALTRASSGEEERRGSDPMWLDVPKIDIVDIDSSKIT